MESKSNFSSIGELVRALDSGELEYSEYYKVERPLPKGFIFITHDDLVSFSELNKQEEKQIIEALWKK